MATAVLPWLGGWSDLTIWVGGRKFEETMEGHGFINRSYSFTALVGCGAEETFQWQWSHSLAGLGDWMAQGSGYGMELTRLRTGEVVAAYSTPIMSSWSRHKWDLEFLGDGRDPRNEFGRLWEVMVVISFLALLEKKRWCRNNGGGGYSYVS
ncbi:hypothetical protein G7Y89_g1824 [Cudoniella acicularis]|uniref:Uncharacterized protein n=1 Tax=Cudoniella acicularis TaxID=354080 RepID=A0A8H4RVB7_9HELO|nr:hypothetical protein G7Y89_g1824 [Cudoniella acicularis]